MFQIIILLFFVGVAHNVRSDPGNQTPAQNSDKPDDRFAYQSQLQQQQEIQQKLPQFARQPQQNLQQGIPQFATQIPQQFGLRETSQENAQQPFTQLSFRNTPQFRGFPQQPTLPQFQVTRLQPQIASAAPQPTPSPQPTPLATRSQQFIPQPQFESRLPQFNTQPTQFTPLTNEVVPRTAPQIENFAPDPQTPELPQQPPQPALPRIPQHAQAPQLPQLPRIPQAATPLIPQTYSTAYFNSPAYSLSQTLPLFSAQAALNPYTLSPQVAPIQLPNAYPYTLNSAAAYSGNYPTLLAAANYQPGFPSQLAPQQYPADAALNPSRQEQAQEANQPSGQGELLEN